MTPSQAITIKTGLVRAADLPLDQLLALRESGDAALDHCMRQVVESASSGAREVVAAFNAAPVRRI
jgi:FXSXX-COOH protein